MNYTIEKEGPEYIYQTVAEHIAHRIKSGELKPNSPLPAERRLADEYGVSLGSARHATQLLREWGLVITVRSKGTYVADPKVQANRADATVHTITAGMGSDDLGMAL